MFRSLINTPTSICITIAARSLTRTSANSSSVTGNIPMLIRMVCASARNSSSVGGTSLYCVLTAAEIMFSSIAILGFDISFPPLLSMRELHPDIRRTVRYAQSYQASHAAEYCLAKPKASALTSYAFLSLRFPCHFQSFRHC